MKTVLTVMLVAAEASGDGLGAGMARALKAKLGADNVRFVGVGGAAMAAEGVVSPFDIAELSILGILEGLKAYPRVVRRVRQTVALAAAEKPDVAILIDSWGFTLRVAKGLRALDPSMPLIKYVGPQVWASRPGRAKTLAASVDHLLALHSFDAPWFEREGLPVTVVGSSALAKDFSGADPARLRERIGAAPDDQILLVLPGSRPAEIAHVMPVFEDAVNILKADCPGLHIVIPVADTVAETVKARIAGWPHRAHVLEGEEAKLDAMKAATVALACSGTVTTELALAGCPMVIGYRIGATTYAILKFLIKTPWVTLFNIAARDFVAPEFIQSRCTGPELAKAIAFRLDHPEVREQQVTAQNAALDLMGRSLVHPSETAADAVVKVLREKGRL
ncbi:MAG: lpxB [Caulobacter sp.]|nr:lpxB [Caulobacter sp.]